MKGTWRAITLVSCLLLCIIHNTTASAAQLRIVPSDKTALQTTVNANFAFETPLNVEILDGSGNRITGTGADATAEITANTNSSGCLIDATFNLVNGVGEFKGSFCDPIADGVVNLWFTTGSLTSDLSPDLTVGGDIHMASFYKHNMESAAEEARWSKIYLNMYNEGILAPTFTKQMPNRTFHIKNYIHHGTHEGGLQAFKEMKDHEKANPSQRAHSVLGTSDNDITKLLLPLFTKEKYSLLSTRNDIDPSFSDQVKFPYYNRLCTSKSYLYNAIGGFLKARSWFKVVMIYDENTNPGSEFEKQLTANGVEILAEYSIDNNDFPTVNKDWKNNEVFDYIMNGIKETGTQIILNFATGNAFLTLLGSAMRNGVTSYRSAKEKEECFLKNEYYQWITIGEKAKRDFPWQNRPEICHAYEPAADDVQYPIIEERYWGRSTWCSVRFKGMLFLNEEYELVDHGANIEWYLAELEYIYANFHFEYGNRLFHSYPYRTKKWITEIARAYDASKLHVAVYKKLIADKKTITADLIAKELRLQRIGGLTKKEFKLDESQSELLLTLSIYWAAHDYRIVYWRNFDRWNARKTEEDYVFSENNRCFNPDVAIRQLKFTGMNKLHYELQIWTFGQGNKRLQFVHEYLKGHISIPNLEESKAVIGDGETDNRKFKEDHYLTKVDEDYTGSTGPQCMKLKKKGDAGKYAIQQYFSKRMKPTILDDYVGEGRVGGEGMYIRWDQSIRSHYYEFYDFKLSSAEYDKMSDPYYLKPYQILDHTPQNVEEYNFPNWFCSEGCGGGLKNTDLSVSDINEYNNGICVKKDTCECKTDANGVQLYTGRRCDVPVCPQGCVHGECTEPGKCVCIHTIKKSSEGGVLEVFKYKGKSEKIQDCSVPICKNCDTSDSGGGICVGPDQCSCKLNKDKPFYGSDCGKQCKCSPDGTERKADGSIDCGSGTQGDGQCKCKSGYSGDDCSMPWRTVLIVVLVLVVIGSILAVFCVKYCVARKSKKDALENNDWIVNWADLKKHEDMMGKSGRSSMFLSALSMNQNREKKICNTGVWNGIDVHYQRIEKDTVPASNEVRYEVKRMRDLKHENIVTFLGACLDAPNVSILTEIAPKGSLEDLLSNEDIKVPWDFRYPIMKGICQGMLKLHGSEIGRHGRLKSSNVLIDGRWTPKITGFGLHSIRRGANNVQQFDHINLKQNFVDMERADYGSLLWTAPEELIKGYSHIDHVYMGGTQENDVYSFGMLMSELCTREHPFSEIMLEKKDIIDLIKGMRNDVAIKVWNDYIASLNMESGGLIRPVIKDEQWPKKYEQRKALKKLMDECWHQDSHQRPSFSQIIAEITRIDPMQSEIMDRLVKMLEKYSTNLESVVTKRTKQLAREKQKTEDLVSRLLPKSVSEDLKMGKRVEPENFEAVTIFFSDIVGFTNIARGSTPIQVVTLLNDMYTSFDAISANYDCYKVETIGDAYMIVSGLPIRNGDKHANEIATCAMDLICSIKDFKIRHMPDTVMQLRVGLHTGNVVAGVVGLKMPRYCLFGETVNVAAEMESGGAAMRIHISEYTKNVLDRIGGFETEHRGEQEVKGKMIQTYWLNGKKGYGKDLPEAPPLTE